MSKNLIRWTRLEEGDNELGQYERCKSDYASALKIPVMDTSAGSFPVGSAGIKI